MYYIYLLLILIFKKIAASVAILGTAFVAAIIGSIFFWRKKRATKNRMLFRNSSTVQMSPVQSQT